MSRARTSTIEYRWAEGQYDRLPALAAELVRRQVAVILPPAATCRAGCKGGDRDNSDRFTQRRGPGRSGLVASLSRPGGNLPAYESSMSSWRRSGWKCCARLLPTRTRDRRARQSEQSRDAESNARNVRSGAAPWAASSDPESQHRARARNGLRDPCRNACRSARHRRRRPFFIAGREQIAALAARYAVPAIYRVS